MINTADISYTTQHSLGEISFRNNDNRYKKKKRKGRNRKTMTRITRTLSLSRPGSFSPRWTETLRTEILLIKRCSPHRDVHAHRKWVVSLLRLYFVLLLPRDLFFPRLYVIARHPGLHTLPEVVRVRLSSTTGAPSPREANLASCKTLPGTHRPSRHERQRTRSHRRCYRRYRRRNAQELTDYGPVH